MTKDHPAMVNKRRKLDSSFEEKFVWNSMRALDVENCGENPSKNQNIFTKKYLKIFYLHQDYTVDFYNWGGCTCQNSTSVCSMLSYSYGMEVFLADISSITVKACTIITLFSKYYADMQSNNFFLFCLDVYFRLE